MNAESTFNSHQLLGGGSSIERRVKQRYTLAPGGGTKRAVFSQQENLLTVNQRVQKSEKKVS